MDGSRAQLLFPLGEQMEYTLLIDAVELPQNKRQIEIETELLEALGG